MRFFWVLALFANTANAAPVDICAPADGAKYFLSQWTEGVRNFDLLSRIEGEKLSIEEGKVDTSEDVNGDGVKDFIFLSCSSAGSSGDFIYEFLIQKKGDRFICGAEIV